MTPELVPVWTGAIDRQWETADQHQPTPQDRATARRNHDGRALMPLSRDAYGKRTTAVLEALAAGHTTTAAIAAATRYNTQAVRIVLAHLRDGGRVVRRGGLKTATYTLTGKPAPTRGRRPANTTTAPKD